jgi:hypothetical protein
MNSRQEHPLQEGQELIGILETDQPDDDDHGEPSDDELAMSAGDPSGAPWNQIIAAVDREFLPLHATSPWILRRRPTR